MPKATKIVIEFDDEDWRSHATDSSTESSLQAIERALAKSPASRFATLQEWRAAIKPAMSFSTSGSTPRIAVIGLGYVGLPLVVEFTNNKNAFA